MDPRSHVVQESGGGFESLFFVTRSLGLDHIAGFSTNTASTLMTTVSKTSDNFVVGLRLRTVIDIIILRHLTAVERRLGVCTDGR